MFHRIKFAERFETITHDYKPDREYRLEDWQIKDLTQAGAKLIPVEETRTATKQPQRRAVTDGSRSGS